MKKCPYCAEEIRAEAIVCRYCGREVDLELMEKVPSGRAHKPNTPGDVQGIQVQVATSERATTNRVVRSNRWGQVGLAVFLGGAIPMALTVAVLALLNTVGIDSLSPGLYALVSAVYLLVVFLLHLVPLPFGFWAGLAWPGLRLIGNIVLGLSAGLVELLTGWVLSSLLASVSGPLATTAYLFALGTISLFIAGALFADLCEALTAVMNLRRIRDMWRVFMNLWGKWESYRRGEVLEPDKPQVTEREAGQADSVSSGKPSEGLHRRGEVLELDKPQATEREAGQVGTVGESKFSENTVLLIQTLVPGCFVLTGAIINAVTLLINGGRLL